MKILQWRYGLWLLPLVFWLSINNAQAVDITCTASMNSGTVNISNAITPTNANDEEITGNLNYSCTNNGAAAVYASVRLGVKSGDTSTLNSSYMSGPNSSKLAYKMTLPNGTLWGDGNNNSSEYLSDPFLIAPSETVTRSATVKTALLSGHNNAYAKEGVHINNSYITLTYDSDKDSTARLNDENGSEAATQFPFTVQATVVASCKITAKPTDINLKAAASATHITGQNSGIKVICTNAALYNIGLSPLSGNSNGNGTGIMSGNIGNPDKIPYQLRSEAGLDGKPWGNNGATYATLTNGVTGIGNGSEQSHTVYVTVPSADVRPDTYSDIVTISVNY